MDLEFTRNHERYSFLKWAADSFDNVSVSGPGKGICHQLNIERFASVALVKNGQGVVVDPDCACERSEGRPAERAFATVCFDTLVGTDSHTPTANGIGVLGWGVGGIEAEAAALGQPITTLVPRVVGVRLTGALAAGAEAMDVALTFAETLRAHGVVGCFVECFGPGVAALSATQRACIANMTPEYGATATLFPVDSETVSFLRMTGRSAAQVALVEAYARAQGVWSEGSSPDASSAFEAGERYAEVVEIDLASVRPSMAGPARPHDRFDRMQAKERFAATCRARGLDRSMRVGVEVAGAHAELTHGAIAIAALTSCTTATDPRMMLACGLVAKRAVQAGLAPKPWVKCIFAPGSHSTERLLARAGLIEPLRALTFHTCGFGCMSCIGNSGPILGPLHDVADRIDLAAVLSSNRNFEGRISPDVALNYLMAPAAVVVYALAGTMDFDFENEPLGVDACGAPVFARDLMPSTSEVDALVRAYVDASVYTPRADDRREKKASGTAACAAAVASSAASVHAVSLQGLSDTSAADRAWDALAAKPSVTFPWDASSTYVRRPPYFDGMKRALDPVAPVRGARVLALLGDFITTDHISPAGSIAPQTPAARYLVDAGVSPEDFNSLGARRGNHEVMMRATFGNGRLENRLAHGRAGGWTWDFTRGELRPIFDAAKAYERCDVPVIVIAGKMYGSGSSRDWAAKGPALQGVRAVIAESFERIHRSNLIGMGILPLQFAAGDSAQALGLDGTEVFDIEPVDCTGGLPEPRDARVVARRSDGSVTEFMTTVRIDTPTEGAYFAHGGILPFVLRSML